MVGRLFAGLTGLIGYVCTATVITAVLGLVYLLKTDRLNDEKMFRMVALYHDVDLNKLAEAQRKTTDEVPPEEISLEQALRRQQVTDRNFEQKLLELSRERKEFDYRQKSLNDLIARNDRMAQDLESRLKKQEELTTQENLTTVVQHLETMTPEIAKDELMQWLQEDRMDDVILLMSKMQEKKLGSILKKFEGEKELTKLKEIHQRIIDGKDKASNVKSAIEEMKSQNSRK
jgi:hypothetical protein